MTDPLAQVVTLLQPTAPFSKLATAAGNWSVRRSETGTPFYCAVLEGQCRLTANDHPPITLAAGDFVLIPSAHDFEMSSLVRPATASPAPVPTADCAVRLGRPDGPDDVRLLVGYCAFGSPDSALLVSLLPQLVHVRGQPRLTALMQMVREEFLAARPARDIVLARLLEVLLIETLRSTAETTASPGLLRGLADERLAAAIRRLHESPSAPWTVGQLAREAGLSRSAFFERFSRAVGVAPMHYLLAWRMALAKNLLRRREGRIAEVAERVGYSSASTFSVAFTRHVGLPPAQYARAGAEAQPL